MMQDDDLTRRFAREDTTRIVKEAPQDRLQRPLLCLSKDISAAYAFTSPERGYLDARADKGYELLTLMKTRLAEGSHDPIEPKGGSRPAERLIVPAPRTAPPEVSIQKIIHIEIDYTPRRPHATFYASDVACVTWLAASVQALEHPDPLLETCVNGAIADRLDRFADSFPRLERYASQLESLALSQPLRGTQPKEAIPVFGITIGGLLDSVFPRITYGVSRIDRKPDACELLRYRRHGSRMDRLDPIAYKIDIPLSQEDVNIPST